MNLANMTRNMADDVKVTGVELLDRAARMKEDVARNTEAALDATARGARGVRQVTEDAIEDTRHEIKQHPLTATAAAGFVGAALGLAAGWFLASRHRCDKCG
ncbi:MAG: hypothetical protein HYX26_02865 [Acidobacteriales bacterium]|nr:hypothetical protein [Terriglobales bacterium]